MTSHSLWFLSQLMASKPSAADWGLYLANVQAGSCRLKADLCAAWLRSFRRGTGCGGAAARELGSCAAFGRAASCVLAWPCALHASPELPQAPKQQWHVADPVVKTCAQSGNRRSYKPASAVMCGRHCHRVLVGPSSRVSWAGYTGDCLAHCSIIIGLYTPTWCLMLAQQATWQG